MSKFIWAVVVTGISIGLVVLPWFFRGLYGLDWTDTTYHFQQALNVVNGKVPNLDFDSHVPGLSFVLEAKLLQVIGVHFEIHRMLGLIVPLLVCFSVVFVALSIGNEHVNKNSVTLSVVLAMGVCASFWGEQLYWNFSALGGALSFLAGVFVFLSLRSESLGRYSFFLTLTSALIGLVFLTKQSHGVLVFLMVCVAIAIEPFIQPLRFRSVSAAVNALLGVSILLLGSVFSSTFGYAMICGWECGSVIQGFVGGSLHLKGLSTNELSGITATILGFNSLEEAKDLILYALVVVVFLAISKFSYSFRISCFLFLAVGPPFLLYIRFADSGNNSEEKLHYYALALAMIVYSAVLYRAFKCKRTNAYVPADCAGIKDAIALTGFSLPVLAVIFAEQLSWPGKYYIHHFFTFPFFLVVIVIVGHLSKSKTQQFGRLYTYVGAGIIALFAFSSLILVDTWPRIYVQRDSQITKLETPASFRGWPVSAKTKAAIGQLTRVVETCSRGPVFQAFWSPILYEILDRQNATSFDLPYHDTISIADAKRLIEELEVAPPSVIVVDHERLEYNGPFPAEGMKAVAFFMERTLLPQYGHKARVYDDFKTFDVYCLKSDGAEKAQAVN